SEREEVHVRVERVEPACPRRALLVRDRDGGLPARLARLAASAGGRGQREADHEREGHKSLHRPLLPGVSIVLKALVSSSRARRWASGLAPSSSRPSRAAPTTGGELVTFTVASGATSWRPDATALISRSSPDCIRPPPRTTSTGPAVRSSRSSATPIIVTTSSARRATIVAAVSSRVASATTT